MSAYWQIDKEWLRVEYLDKMRSVRDIAKGVGCAKTTVLYRLRKYGIRVRKRGESRKLVASDYYALAQRRGFEWISSELPISTHAKSQWRCSQGHRWEVSYHSIQQGFGCPYCAGVVPKVVEDYHALAKDRGFGWIGSGRLVNVDAKTRWRCDQGHEWETRYHNIKRGEGCPYCSNRVPKIAENYHALARDRGFEWLGLETPRKVSIKTRWRCSQDHEWEISYNHIQQGHGCSICYILWNRGENHSNWRGGSSPYGLEFNGELKSAIRARDSFTCQICSKSENGKAHDCHHIDYDKKHNHSHNLITLCRSCHSQTGGGDRDTWRRKLSAIIFTRHGQGSG